MAKIKLKDLLPEGLKNVKSRPLNETDAGEQAKAIGLVHTGWGRYARADDPKRKTVAITHNGQLTKVGTGDHDTVHSDVIPTDADYSTAQQDIQRYGVDGAIQRYKQASQDPRFAGKPGNPFQRVIKAATDIASGADAMSSTDYNRTAQTKPDLKVVRGGLAPDRTPGLDAVETPDDDFGPGLTEPNEQQTKKAQDMANHFGPKKAAQIVATHWPDDNPDKFAVAQVLDQLYQKSQEPSPEQEADAEAEDEYHRNPGLYGPDQ